MPLEIPFKQPLFEIPCHTDKTIRRRDWNQSDV